MKYTDIIKENGFLSKSGEQLMAEKLTPAIKELLQIGTTENEIRIIGSILSNLIGKEVINTIQFNNDQKLLVEKITEVLQEGLKSFIGIPNNKEVQDQIEKEIEEKSAHYESGGFIVDPFENDPNMKDWDKKY